MTGDELDMVVLAHLDAHRHASTDGAQDQGSHRVVIDYYFQGKRVCKDTYRFVHAIGPKKFKNLVDHFNNHGLVPRVHGNAKRLPANAISFDKTKSVIKFISNFAAIHALPLPGRLPGQFNFEKALLLPSQMSKRYVYRQYKLACESDIPVGRRKFENLWNGLVPHITCMKPATDLCAICQNNVVKIFRSVNLPESEKTDALKEAQSHLRLAKLERCVYNAECVQCVEELKSNPESPKVLHVSFDYAQQIHFPNSPQQVGPLYFLTPRKCQLFGICSEAHMQQVNYLIDESDSPGKGANAVVSMVHHYLEFKLPSCQHLLMHADNAVGQNKNNIVLGYLAWRILSGRNRTIRLSFMLPGHTKFAPDRFFGQIKKLYRRTSVSTLIDIEDVVKSSILDGRNIPQMTVDCRTGERYVTWYNWSEYLGKYFQTLPGILKYHHFRLDTSELGTVFTKEYEDSNEIEFNILRCEPDDSVNDLPSTITPPGMSADRQQYLFDNIRQYCPNDTAANLTCPLPAREEIENPQSKRRKKGKESSKGKDKTISSKGKKNSKSQRKCSNCHKTGHTKTVRGKITCPELL
jgi:hypothetical protein